MWNFCSSSLSFLSEPFKIRLIGSLFSVNPAFSEWLIFGSGLRRRKHSCPLNDSHDFPQETASKPSNNIAINSSLCCIAEPVSDSPACQILLPSQELRKINHREEETLVGTYCPSLLQSLVSSFSSRIASHCQSRWRRSASIVTCFHSFYGTNSRATDVHLTSYIPINPTLAWPLTRSLSHSRSRPLRHAYA